MSPSILCLFLSILVINSFASKCDEYSSKLKPYEIAKITCGQYPTRHNRLNVKLVKYVCDSGYFAFLLDTTMFSTYPNVRAVDISHLNIHYLNVQDQTFNKKIGANVVSLNASHNKLAGLKGQNLECMANLREMDFSFNNITKVDSQVISTFQHLEILNLRNNFIEFLDDFLFKNNLNLISLDLRSNPLNSFNFNIFSKSPRASVNIHLPPKIIRNFNGLDIKCKGSTCVFKTSKVIM